MSGVSVARFHKASSSVTGQRGMSAVSRALACLQVFEQSPNFAKAGALLGLAVNSQKALAAIDPSLMQQVEAVAVSPGRSLTFSHTGVSLTFSHTGVHALQNSDALSFHPTSACLPATAAAAAAAVP